MSANQKKIEKAVSVGRSHQTVIQSKVSGCMPHTIESLSCDTVATEGGTVVVWFTRIDKYSDLIAKS